MTSGPRRELSVDEITELLTELGRRLSAKGVSASLYGHHHALPSHEELELSARAVLEGMARRRR